MFRHLGFFSYGFRKDVSERVPWKVLHFYILFHFTLTRGAGVTKGGVEASTHLVSYLLLCSHGEDGLKHIYLICDLNKDLFNDLMI